MAMNIGILIVSIGFFIFVIALSFNIFLDAWEKLPDTFKIPHVRKPETPEIPDPSQAPQDKPPYLWDVCLYAMRRDLDRLHCELKALESRIDNRKD